MCEPCDQSHRDCLPQVQAQDAEAAAARAEVAGLRSERHEVDKAVEELRTMLMQSVSERSRLAGEAAAHEQRIAALQRVCFTVVVLSKR